MADEVLSVPNVVIGGNDWTAYIMAIRFTPKREDQDNTASGGGGRTNFKGLKNWDLELEVKLDAAGVMRGYLYDLWNNGVAVTAVFSHAGATESAANPEWTGSVTMGDVDLINGAIGDLQKTTVPFLAAGAVSRDVT